MSSFLTRCFCSRILLTANASDMSKFLHSKTNQLINSKTGSDLIRTEISFSMPGQKRHENVTTEADKANVDRQSVLYQLYKPQLKDVLTVKLAIGGSENIDCSNSEYSVGVSFQYSMERYGETILKSASKKSPNWNEALTFHINKFHLQELDIACSKLVFKLMKHESKILTSECSKECYLRDILKNQKVVFKAHSKWSIVNITKVEIHHQPDVKVGNQLHLCEDEEIFFEKRKKCVNEELHKQRLDENKILYGIERVPNIAVIGSGGGMRAVVGMCGAMVALKDLGILDAAMYTAGVSGSSWYLSTLYANKHEINPTSVKNSIQERLQSAPETFIRLLMSSLEVFISHIFDGDISLTDIYGDKVGAILLGKDHIPKWSDLRETLQHAELPLPLLAAVHVRDSKTKITDFHEWIECSPYEVFMPKYGTSIDMKHFGSEFDGGFITKRCAEKNIYFIQGMCGSAYAGLLDYHKKDDGDNFVTRFLDDFINRKIDTIEKEILGKVPNWLHGIPKFHSLCKGDKKMSVPMKENIDQTKDKITLADAGTVCNSPYPLVLHPARQVDVIISFDFSQNTDSSKDDVGELIKAEGWAKRRGLPFPNVEEEINTKPIKKDEMMREFQNGNSPYILHFMMNAGTFLRQENSASSGLTADERVNTEEFTLNKFETMKLNYSELEFKWLSKLMEFNVRESKDLIRDCIQRASKTNQG